MPKRTPVQSVRGVSRSRTPLPEMLATTWLSKCFSPRASISMSGATRRPIAPSTVKASGSWALGGIVLDYAPDCCCPAPAAQGGERLQEQCPLPPLGAFARRRALSPSQPAPTIMTS